MRSLPRTSPEAMGIPSPAILSLIDASEAAGLDLHSLMVLRRGQVIAEGWWEPYQRDDVHLLYSLSKSFTATAIGLAIEEGKLSLDDYVAGFFPESMPADASAHLRQMRVRHLLSMSTGQEADDLMAFYSAPDGDWVRTFLARPVPFEPGTRFMYNSGATYMLSAILTKLTGETVLDYLRPRLFEPLGIECATWETDPKGISVGGWGLSITTESIAKFGQLYLQKGQWEGRQIVPAAWVEIATASHIPNGDNPASDWNQGYGYQFWRCRHDAYRGDGAFGQYCVVMPEQEMVVAITASVGDMQAVLDLLWDHLLPAASPDALPSDDPAQAQLAARLSQLAAARPEGIHQSPPLSSAVYSNGADRVSFTLNGSRIRVEAPSGSFEAGLSDWILGTTTFDVAEPQSVAGQGAWESEKVLAIDLRYIESPAVTRVELRFEGDGLLLKSTRRGRFGGTEGFSFEGESVR